MFTPTAGTTSLSTTAASALAANQPCRRIVIQNDPDNLVAVLLGDSTTQTYQLNAGASVTLDVRNANKIYCKNVSSTTQAINWIALK